MTKMTTAQKILHKTLRKMEKQTEHGTEGKSTLENGQRTDCSVEDICKIKNYDHERAKKNERGREEVPKNIRLRRTNSADIARTQLFVSNLSTLAGKFI